MDETPGQKQSNALMVGIVALLALIVLSGVGYKLYKHVQSLNSAPSQTTQATPTPMEKVMAPTPTTEVTTSATSDHVQVTVTGSNYLFEPKEIRVKEGQTVDITFKNTKGTHDFVLDAFGVKTAVIQANQSVTASFVASKKGSFEYYCSVGNHKAMGMVGTLIVE